jgi:PPOX class probable F420-dependent enzyme
MARSIATVRRVDRDELLEFVRPRHHGILATRRRDGRSQMSPVAMGVDGAGRVVVSTYPERAKVLNLRRDRRCWSSPTTSAARAARGHRRGHRHDSVEPLVEYFRSISGEHPDWAEYRQAMVAQGKSLVRLTIERWGPIATGGFPARLADG